MRGGTHPIADSSLAKQAPVRTSPARRAGYGPLLDSLTYTGFPATRVVAAANLHQYRDQALAPPNNGNLKPEAATLARDTRALRMLEALLPPKPSASGELPSADG